jgi:hypothetical protein
MKKIFFVLIMVVSLSIIPSVFALPENLFNGSSLFEKLPIIQAGKTSDFMIKLFYKSGPYALEDIKPVIDIYPVSLTRYLTINIEPSSGSLYPFSTVHIKGNITASPDIPAGKTSLLYYFVANDTQGNSYKSSWFDSSPPIDIITEQFKAEVKPDVISCKENHVMIKKYNGMSACVSPQTKEKLIQRGWAIKTELSVNNTSIGSNDKSELLPLQVKVVGEKQVRRGTTHTIEVQVVRGDTPIEGARVFIDIEDYGEDLIKEFDGYTNSQGYFVLSWEIPQSFDDIETLLAFIDVTDDISSKTELFKFQVYCLPGEKDCKAEGN